MGRWAYLVCAISFEPSLRFTGKNTFSGLLDSLMMEILQEEEYTYQTYFQLLTFNQIQLLKAIAKEGIVREVNAAAFIKKYDLKAVSSVNTSLRILIDKEFILRQPDGYIVYDRFMSIWLSRI